MTETCSVRKGPDKLAADLNKRRRAKWIAQASREFINKVNFHASVEDCRIRTQRTEYVQDLKKSDIGKYM